MLARGLELITDEPQVKQEDPEVVPGYQGGLVQWVQDGFAWVLEIVKRKPDTQGFEVLPKRWIVERTFAWFMRNRRLCRDYERRPQSSEAFIYIAMIRLMAKRLASLS